MSIAENTDLVATHLTSRKIQSMKHACVKFLFSDQKLQC